ncbi:MAG: AAA family ATPase [Panacagrimonas sp.]
MKSQALVITDDPVYIDWLHNAAPGTDFSRVSSVDADRIEELASGAGKVPLILLQFDAGNAVERAALLEKIAQRMPEVALAAIAESEDPDLMLSAMRAGARDYLVLSRDQEKATALIGKLMRHSLHTGPAANRDGKILAVIGPYPDDGIAFLGEHLALACAERVGGGGRSLLLDLAAPSGAGAIFLDLKQSYGVLDALQDVHRFDATLIETTFARHDSGLHVLSLPEELVGRPQLDAGDLQMLLEGVRGHFACTVITADGHMSLPAVKALLGSADRSILLSNQSILRSRHCKHLVQALRAENAELERLSLVVDNYQKRVGLEPENLAELFELPLLSAIHAQTGHRIQAMNTGKPIFSVAPKDPYCEEVRRLAAAMLGEPVKPAPEARAGGLIGRLFSGS